MINTYEAMNGMVHLMRKGTCQPNCSPYHRRVSRRWSEGQWRRLSVGMMSAGETWQARQEWRIAIVA